MKPIAVIAAPVRMVGDVGGVINFAWRVVVAVLSVFDK
jgi:hypothetical protein